MFVSLLVFIVWFSCKCTDNIFYMQAPAASFLTEKIFCTDSRSPYIIPLIRKPHYLICFIFLSRNIIDRTRPDHRPERLSLSPHMYSEWDLNPHSCNSQGILSPSCLPIPPSEQPLLACCHVICKYRAENETRTRDPNLGKVVLYQLSYFRNCRTGLRPRPEDAAKIDAFIFIRKQKTAKQNAA